MTRAYFPIIALALVVLAVAAWCLYAELHKLADIGNRAENVALREHLIKKDGQIAQLENMLANQEQGFALRHAEYERYLSRVGELQKFRVWRDKGK